MPASALARVNSIAFSMQVSMPAMAASEEAERAEAFPLAPFPSFARRAWAASSCAVLAAAAPRQARTVASAVMRMVRSKASRPSAAMLSSASEPAIPKADCVVPAFALAFIFDSPRLPFTAPAVGCGPAVILRCKIIRPKFLVSTPWRRSLPH